jgi:Protein of unknown function (DUF1302)
MHRALSGVPLSRLGLQLVLVPVFVALSVGTALGVRVDILGRPLQLEGYAELRKGAEVDPGTPSDRFLQTLALRVRYAPTDFLALEIAGLAANGGPTSRNTGAGVYTFTQVFQSRSPSLDLDEAFVDLRDESLELRVGMQKFVWGKLDRFQPTDVLNSERFSDPFLLDETERKLPVPAIQASYYLPAYDELPQEGRLTLVWIPQYFPYRFPLLGERWFPPAALPPSRFGVPEGIVPLPGGGSNPPLSVPLQQTIHNPSLPSFGLDNAGYAARFSAYAGGLDYALCYYHGFDSQPAFELSAEALANPSSSSPLGIDISAQTALTPRFRTIDLWGGDAAYAAGDFTFRGEAAYVRGRPFSRDLRFLVRDPRDIAPQIGEALAKLLSGAGSAPIKPLPDSFVQRDAVEWGIGGDYSRSGYLFLLQVNQTDVLDNGVDLLINDVETRILANLRKRFLRDDLQLQVVGLHAIESDYTALLPQLTYLLWEGLELRVGYVFIAGRQSSVLGQFKRNDEGYVRLRYLF